MTQLIIVIIIVVVVAALSARKIVRRLKGKESSCSCGCENCPAKQLEKQCKKHIKN